MGIGIKRSELSGSGAGAAQQMSDALSNFSPINTAEEDLQNANPFSADREPILSLKMSDEELSRLAKQWMTDYSKYEKTFSSQVKRNKEYWKGEQYGFDRGDYRFVDNVIFAQLETLLPIISRQNPDPLVTCPDVALADDTSNLIEFTADRKALKVKIKKMARHWAISYIGVLKTSWDAVENNIDISVIKPSDIILDPTGTFDGGKFLGRYVGHKRTETAENLTKLFPDKEGEISEFVSKKMGTNVPFIEWHTDEYIFWTMNSNDIVLDKRQNPNWNYDKTVEKMDEMGNVSHETTNGHNHLAAPSKPFAFLSVFTLDERPHDETSLVEQSIPLQDAVNKRGRQIDKSADDANSGWVFNNQFSTEEAASALRSLRNGGAIRTPTTSVGEAVTRLNAPGLPSYVWNDLLDKREQIANMMGTRGSTAAGIASERTVQGKIEIRQSDTDRAALIIEHLEQTVDYLYNYIVQMIFVYYDDKNFNEILGEERGVEYSRFVNSTDAPKLLVSVKEGSLIPQDPLLRRNEAVDLMLQGLLDPLSGFERMNFPNPQETAKRLVQWQNDPMSLIQQEQTGGAEPVNMPPTPQVPPMLPNIQ